jgi:hypothetical protein
VNFWTDGGSRRTIWPIFRAMNTSASAGRQRQLESQEESIRFRSRHRNGPPILIQSISFWYRVPAPNQNLPQTPRKPIHMAELR